MLSKGGGRSRTRMANKRFKHLRYGIVVILRTTDYLQPIDDYLQPIDNDFEIIPFIKSGINVKKSIHNLREVQLLDLVLFSINKYTGCADYYYIINRAQNITSC